MADTSPIAVKDRSSEPESANERADAIIAAALRGDSVDFGQLTRRSETESFFETVDSQRLGPLLHHVLEGRNDRDLLPEAIRDHLAAEAKQAEAMERAQIEETRRLLAALHAERVAPLIIDGTALAYTLYPKPQLRPRQALHLLVRRAAVVDVVRILAELGYPKHRQPPGERILGRDTFQRRDNGDSDHTLNLYWSVGSATEAGRSFDYAELRQRAQQLDSLSPGALVLCHEDALFHPCFQQINQPASITLLSLYDVHLLIQSMTTVEFARFARNVMGTRLAEPMRDVIAKAQATFHTALPFGTLDDHFSPDRLAERARFGAGISPRALRVRKMMAGIREFRVWRLLNSNRGKGTPAETKAESRLGDPASWPPVLYLRRGLQGVAEKLKRSS